MPGVPYAHDQLTRNLPARMTAPLVAITATTRMMEGLPRVRLNEAYADAVRAVGLVPLVLPPIEPPELDSVLAAVDGILFSGGEDVAPSEYGEDTSSRTDAPNRPRDRCELALARLARERKVPSLAVCRGIQVMNVAFGGTLVQDIPTECPSTLRHDRADARASRVHDVTIERDSALARALGATALTVNSSHHQSLARIADGLRVTARAPDGVIEGAEWVADDWWMLGVQWHPEELLRDANDWDRSLFRAFADRVRL
jgi:putative glutamine amidotransferase